MSDVLHTDTPKSELVIRLTHPRIANHKACIHKGIQGWRSDGTIVPCSCVNRILRQEWFKFFPFKKMSSVKFTPESVIASEV